MRVRTDVLVIGAGSGGYVAAIKLGKLGKNVLLIEKDGMEGLGGICMNHGCIPSKALILASKFFHDIKDAGEMGINVSGVSLDASKMQDWKNGVVAKLRTGIDFLMKRNNVKWMKGEAVFESSHSVKINGNPDIDAVDFNYAIVATGALPNTLPGLEFDGQSIISYNEALDLREIPQDLLVVGGGYIAVEMAACYARLGSRVKLVHRREHLLAEYDDDIVNTLQRKMKNDGVEFIFNSNISKVEKIGGRVRVTLENQKQIEVDKVLVAVGVGPNSANLGLNNTTVKLDDKGFVIVDKKMRTTDPRIFAIGDVAGQPLLAHKATKQGKIAAEVIAGRNVEYNNLCVPFVIFGDPEIAIAGLQENEAKKKGYEINIGKFPFSALGRAWIQRETEGFVKIIEEKKTGKVLGVVIIGPDASNMIMEGVLAIEKGLKTEDIINIIHPHPTLTESVMEAAEAVKKMAIHIVDIKL